MNYIIAAIITLSLYLLFIYSEKVLISRQRKIIEAKHSKVIDLYGYVPKAVKNKI